MQAAPDWNESWENVNTFSPMPPNNMFNVFLDKFFPPDLNFKKTAIEIGCFPGRFIDYFGHKGYVISGIDTYPGVVKLNTWMRERHEIIGEFLPISVHEYSQKFNTKYDVVVSFGLIEHFINFPENILQHINLCNED
jgi:2-polyprenyl-3-methyl-5-hydroxy-6-metoxy-1,4-benzoquinol methylase